MPDIGTYLVHLCQAWIRNADAWNAPLWTSHCCVATVNALASTRPSVFSAGATAHGTLRGPRCISAQGSGDAPGRGRPSLMHWHLPENTPLREMRTRAPPGGMAIVGYAFFGSRCFWLVSVRDLWLSKTHNLLVPTRPKA